MATNARSDTNARSANGLCTAWVLDGSDDGLVGAAEKVAENLLAT